MATIKPDGTIILGDSGSSLQNEEDVAVNGCFPITSEKPYRPPCFSPSGEESVMPVIVREKGRVNLNMIGTSSSSDAPSYNLLRSKEVGYSHEVKVSWEYHDGDGYVATTSLSSMEWDSTSGSSNRPRVKIDIRGKVTSELSGNTETFDVSETYYGTQYWTVDPLDISPSPTIEYHNDNRLYNDINNNSKLAVFPSKDEMVFPDGYNGSGSNQGSQAGIYSVMNWNSMAFLYASANEIVVADAGDPNDLNTGPTYAVAFELLSEENNEIGRLVNGKGKIKYNFVTNIWEPF